MQFLNVGVARVAPLVLAAVLLPGGASAQTLKVLDWNTHHGVGTDGAYNLQRFVTWIVRSGAHVVSLNEVEKNNSWGNEDQPARYAALLRAATGKTWYYTFAQRDGGTNGQGNLILSTFPFEATGATTLSYSRSVARAQIVVNGVRVNIFSTHLDADSSSRRATQMDELKSWAAGYSQQHIIAGDFNAWPGADGNQQHDRCRPRCLGTSLRPTAHPSLTTATTRATPATAASITSGIRRVPRSWC